MFRGHRTCRRGDIRFSICHVTSRGHMIRGSLCVRFPHHESYSTKFGGHWTCKYFAFDLSRDVMWLREQRVMWHYGWVPLIITLHPAKFGGHRLCAREKNPFFICHVTARDFWVRESCDIGNLKNHRHFRREDNKLSIFHVTSRDHMVRGSCKHMGEFCSS